MPFTINHNTPVLFGEGVSGQTGEKLKEYGVKKVLFVYDQGLKSAGIADKIIKNIKEKDIGVIEFDDVKPDPPVEVIDEAGELARKENVDAVIGIGGGSSMDTAKAVNVLLGNPGSIKEYLNPAVPQKPGKMVFAIPTTAGTGSEVTNIAVVSNKEAGLKQGLMGPNTTAKLAIIDPELTYGLSPGLTAAGGMDAFSHAAEAYTSFLSNPMTDLLSIEAIRLIAKYLPVAVKDGKNIEARSKLSFASTIAGMSFNEAMVHLGHAIAHSMGAVHHIPHGLGCGLALPMALEYLSENIPDKLRSIGNAMELELKNDLTNEEVGKTVADAIRSMNKKMGLPALNDLGFGEEALSNIVHEAT
ncbi:MAG: iron-containing alcohol dehydrogenase, partial [Deltaproteobacteria bacterium]|nr:iron-containing alcohol dehydrogenase [Deltaproteobacteria bacterium]